MNMKFLPTILFMAFLVQGYSQTDTPDHIQTDPTDVSQRVVGGVLAEEQEFPWMVTLITDAGQGCGASLIAPQWVLTAGHCFIDFPGAPQNTQVLINSLITDASAMAPFSELIDIEASFVHEGFNLFTGGPDIALIRLSEPALTVPVAIAEYSDSLFWSHQMPGKVLGWGKEVAGGDSVDSLLVGNLFYIDIDTCSVLYDASANGNQIEGFEDRKVCAGFYPGVDPVGAAQGDSGGPLFFDDNGTYKQVGIVSGGDSDVTTEGFPGIFTFIPVYRDWMEDIMSQYDMNTSTTLINKEELNIEHYANDRIRISNLNVSDDYTFEMYDFSGKAKAIVAQNNDGSIRDFMISEVQSGMYVFVIRNHTKAYLTNHKLFVR